LQILLAGAIMAWIGFRLWPRRPEAEADDAKPALASTKNPAPARGAMR